MQMTQQQVLELTNPQKFDAYFFKLCQQHTQEQAYEILEDYYSALFKTRRYANFESYRISRHKRLRG